MTMTSQELRGILASHAKWLHGEDGGSRANLFEANLFEANLFEANLFEANLFEANLFEADLSEANGVIDLGSPDGWRALAYIAPSKTMHIRVGCRDKTLAEGRVHWADKNNRREVLAALDYAEAIARLRGWEV